MEISTEVKDNIRYQMVKGVIDINELISHLKQIYSSSDFNPNMDVFWNLCEADFSSLPTEDIRRFMEFVGDHWGKNDNSKAAIIVSNDLGFGLSRMYEMLLSSETSSKVNVFRGIDKANEWMKQSE